MRVTMEISLGRLTNAVKRYVEDVGEGKFPADEDAHYSRNV